MVEFIVGVFMGTILGIALVNLIDSYKNESERNHEKVQDNI